MVGLCIYYNGHQRSLEWPKRAGWPWHDIIKASCEGSRLQRNKAAKNATVPISFDRVIFRSTMVTHVLKWHSNVLLLSSTSDFQS